MFDLASGYLKGRVPGPPAPEVLLQAHAGEEGRQLGHGGPGPGLLQEPPVRRGAAKTARRRAKRVQNVIVYYSVLVVFLV